jgi:gliding motility-associated-like protein
VFSQTGILPDQTWDIPFGMVRDAIILENQNKIIYGGFFKYVGLPNANAAELNLSSQIANPDFPHFNGEVFASEPDGIGGWFVSGNFTHVENVARSKFVYIDSAGSVHTWAPTINGDVVDMERVGNLLYLAGNFTTVNGQARKHLACFDLNTFTLTSWSPANTSTSGWVLSIDIENDVAYIGGNFNNIVGKTNICAVSTATGAAIPANASLWSTVMVKKLIATNGRLFILDSNLVPKYFDITSPSSIALNSWAPAANNWVNNILEDNGILYMCGTFTQIGGLARNQLAAYDYVNDTYLATTLGINITNVVSLAKSGDQLFIGCYYSGDAQDQEDGFVNRLIMVNAQSGALQTAPKVFNGAVNNISIANGKVLLGGQFFSAGGKRKTNLAMVNLATKRVMDWGPIVHTNDPSLFASYGNEGINTMATDSVALYIGGDFGNVDNQVRTNLAAVDLSTGIPTSFSAQLSTSTYVKTILLNGDDLLVGGNFTSISSVSRNYLAALNKVTGAVGTWNPNPNQLVSALYKKNNVLYVGGGFNSIAGQSTNIGRFNTATYTALPAFNSISGTNANYDGAILGFEERDGLLYVFGGFNYFGFNNLSLGRKNLVVFDLAANSHYADPNNYFNTTNFLSNTTSVTYSRVRDIHFDNDVLYLSSTFGDDPVNYANNAFSPNSSTSCYNPVFIPNPLITSPIGYKVLTYNDQLLVMGCFRGYSAPAGNYFLNTGSVVIRQKPPGVLTNLTYNPNAITGVAGTPITPLNPSNNNASSYQCTNLPAGLSINATTGVISGTPTAAFSGNITIVATNACYTKNIVVSVLISGSPQLSITAVSNIKTTSAATLLEVAYDGGSTLTARGIYLSTSPNPGPANTVITAETGMGAIIIAMNALQPNTTYYVKGFATNASGTSLTPELNFTTKQGPNISYTSPTSLQVNTLMTPLQVLNTGSEITAASVGTVSTIAGTTLGFLDGAGTVAKFYNPRSICQNGVGTYFISDNLGNRVRQMDSLFNVANYAGTGVSGFLNGTAQQAKFTYPFGIVSDKYANVYVVDNYNHKIRKIAYDGTVTTFAGSSAGNTNGTGVAAQFNSPRGLAIDTAGNLYVADAGNHLIRKITPAGEVSTYAGSTLGFLDGPGSSAKFYTPTDLVMDTDGNLYVADLSNNRIRKITPAGEVSTFAGSATATSTNGIGTAATFNGPHGIAIDDNHNLYVTEASGHKIRKISPNQVVTTIAGTTQGANNGTAATAQFNKPTDAVYNGFGSLYVVDENNHKIRAVNLYQSYVISPNLPTGLTFNTTTGQISGTPTTTTALTTYTIIGSNQFGADTFELALQVVAPMTLISFNPSSGYIGSSVTIYGTNLSSVNSVSINGTPVTSFVVYGNDSIIAVVAPNTTTGLISISNGAQTLSSSSNYTVLSNPAIGLAYTPATQSVNLGTALSNMVPSYSGGPITSFSISPSLPGGLLLNSSTGVISGTALNAAALTTYTITGSFATGTIQATVTIAIINDSDGDGIPDSTEGTTDTDNDGTPNYLDTDSDGDGIPDSTEGTTDTDNDGTPNYLDTDSDGDGIPDATEGTTDTDNDGIPNYLDTDSDGDGIPDSTEGITDTDNDGIPNYLDTDSDGDGIPDATEGTTDTDNDGIPNYLDTDSDGDGIPDATEGTTDTDGDGTPNYLDLDSDGDGIPDSTEGTTDTDNDGTPNYLDTDSDGDGIPDATEGTTDTDNDGIPNYLDTDSDGDGIPDSTEGTTDTDNDGTPNYLDTDSDGDGIPDATEGTTDTDNDGTPNYLDTDSDGDGIPDSTEGTTDTDGDGTPNYLDTDSDGDSIPDSTEGTTDTDVDGTPNYLDTDSDGDGILDATEGTTDSDNDGTPNYLDTDSDGDGIPDSTEGTTDTDNDGTPNYLDTDSDGDGIPDSTEGTTDTDNDGTPNYLDTDSDGDGIPDSTEGTTDTDGDGTSNYLDLDSDGDSIPDATEGTTDTDNDGTPNYLDTDSDGDGISDSTEGTTDTDNDGTPNYLDTDSDGDGIPDSTEGTTDTDNDGTPNYLDTDSDGDSIPDATEGITDTDNDGIPNYLDTDSDGDGIPDSTEGTTDTDNDGIPNYLDTDSDGDGIPDSTEGTTDSDNDGTPNYLDTDSDGDGIPDSTEGTTDTDGDGTSNYLDLDSDGDSIPDATEGTTDTDNDGTPNYLDTDSDGDGISDSTEGTTDTDNDGTPNYLDTDSDGDGIPDSTEGTTDTDNDGTPNYLDTDSDGDSIPDATEGITDTDNDGIPNYLDTDSDGDGIPDSTEGTTDTDNDGIPNYLDTDSDGDGIPDSTEGTTDTDNDGTPNYLDTDSDGDGIPDSTEGTSDTDGDGTSNYLDLDSDGDSIPDATEGITDTDNDGTPNYLDTDSDGDGISDSTEGTTDTDNDGIPNYLDTDSDGDGIPDATEGTTDTDNDGIPNYLDTDSDGDGIPDATEGTTDTDNDSTPNYLDTDSDGDGIPDSTEGTTDSDNDGIPNYLDTDSDGDGISDEDEGTGDFDNDGTPNYLDTDADGDGVSDGQEILDGTNLNDPCDFLWTSVTLSQGDNFLSADCDGDGLSNGEEQGSNPNKPLDSNANGVADYLEYNAHQDTEDDLEPFEAVSPNGDGMNDVFVIRNIENYPANELQIYNRWGVAVYDVTGYGQQNQFFEGYSKGRLTIHSEEALPDGTYFWVLHYEVNGQQKVRKGYIYLNR